MMPVKKKPEPPKAIYLQLYCEEHDSSYGNPDPGDVTWCKDKIFNDDVRYVLDRRNKPKLRQP